MNQSGNGDELGLAGTTVAGKYAIECAVGEGGFATVYRAKHLLWNCPVAIKVFRAWAQVPDENRARLYDGFLREGAVLADLSSRTPAIVQARDVGMLETSTGQPLPYLVLEWVDGRTLEAVLLEEATVGMARRGVVETLRFLKPIAAALGLAHAAGVVHRDIKAGNILVLGNPRHDPGLKLVDFGVAKIMSDVITAAGVLATTNHEFRSLTPAYAAPEQFSRDYGATGPWTDVFAFALLIVEVLSGRDPLEGAVYEELAAASRDPARRPTPRTLGVDVSDRVEAVFARALAVRPEERWPNASAFWIALEGAIDASPRTVVSGSERPSRLASSGRGSLPATAETVPPPGARTQSRPRARAHPLTMLALVAAGVGVLVGVVGFARARKVDSTAPAPSAEAARVPASPGEAAVRTVSPRAACPQGMVPIPGGSFFMGSDDGLAMERPAHPVTLAPFCMDEFEVTVAAYASCSDVGRCKRASSNNAWDGISEKDKDAFDPLCNARQPEARANHPVNCVDWSMAERFCHENDKRLPTEAEWEFAARGPDGRKYPWGDEEPTADYLNACGSECAAWGRKNQVEEKAMYASDDGYPSTAPVGSFPKGASRYGVKDVVGNVWEWVADWYGPYGDAEQADPKGPADGEQRVIRGGAWNGSFAAWVRPTFRYKVDPRQRSYGVGFRCAR